jgi:hypothetical protein
MLYLVAFTQSWTNIPWTVSAELPSNRLRDKTLTIGAWSGYGVGLIITFVQPYLQDAINGGVGFIYGAIGVVAAIYSESSRVERIASGTSIEACTG